MTTEVRGVIAKAVGEPVTIETVLVPDPGPGEALVTSRPAGSATQTSTTARVASATTSPSCSATRPPAPSRRWTGRRVGQARRLRRAQLAGGLRPVPVVPPRQALVLLLDVQRHPEDDARPTAPSCRRPSGSGRSPTRRSSPPDSAHRSTAEAQRRGCRPARLRGHGRPRRRHVHGRDPAR